MTATAAGAITAGTAVRRPWVPLAREVGTWTLAALGFSVVSSAVVALIAMRRHGDLPWDLVRSVGTGGLTAIGVVVAIGLWTRFAAWLTAGVRRRDMGAALAALAVADTALHLVLVAGMAGLAGGSFEAGTLARFALAGVAVHVGALHVVCAYLRWGSWWATALLPLSVPFLPWVAIVLEGVAPAAVLTALHVAWLAPALLTAPYVLRATPAPRRIA